MTSDEIVVYAEDGRQDAVQQKQDQWIRWHSKTVYDPSELVIVRPRCQRRRPTRNLRETTFTDPYKLAKINHEIDKLLMKMSLASRGPPDWHAPIQPIPVAGEFFEDPSARDQALDFNLERYISTPHERFLGRLRPEGAKLLPESQIEKYWEPTHTFLDLAHCKSLMRQPHRKGSIIIPIAGQHPYVAMVGQWTSTPQWDMLSGELRPISAGLPEPIRLTFTRLYTLWAKLDECLATSRFGLGSIEFVRTARSAYFAVHCHAERAAHAIGWIKVWTKDPATDERFMDDVRLAWIDGPTRQPLVLF